MMRRATRLLAGGTAAVLDRAALLAARASARRGRAARLSHSERIRRVREIARLYSGTADEGFFRRALAIDVAERTVRVSEGLSVLDVSWPSRYEVFLGSYAERYHRHRDNQVAAARLFVRQRPRPLAILVHGYLGGVYKWEQRAWPLEWFDRIGLDTALFVLPFHAVRGDPQRAQGPVFPSGDPRMNHEAFRQAMGDLRDLVKWAQDRGHEQVGVMGMSLGGYTTALAATVAQELAFAVPIIPLASMADFARAGSRDPSIADGGELYACLHEAHRAVSPLHRPLVLEKQRVMVIGAQADRITPVQQARRIAHHFGVPLTAWHGGHLLQFGRADKFRQIGRFLEGLGLTARR